MHNITQEHFVDILRADKILQRFVFCFQLFRKADELMSKERYVNIAAAIIIRIDTVNYQFSF